MKSSHFAIFITIFYSFFKNTGVANGQQFSWRRLSWLQGCSLHNISCYLLTPESTFSQRGKTLGRHLLLEISYSFQYVVYRPQVPSCDIPESHLFSEHTRTHDTFEVSRFWLVFGQWFIALGTGANMLERSSKLTCTVFSGTSSQFLILEYISFLVLLFIFLVCF